MKKRVVHFLLAASLLSPLVGTAATLHQAVIKVGKIRVVKLTDARGMYRFTQSGDASFDGCTVDPSYIFSYFPVGQTGGDDLRWQLLLEAKRSNADLRILYAVNGPDSQGAGRCALLGLELQ